MKRAVLTAALFLAACAGTPREPQIEIQPVNKPVAVPCVDDSVPPAPVYPDTKEALRAAAEFSARYDLMAKGWEPRDRRLTLLESIIAICRKVPQPPSQKVVK